MYIYIPKRYINIYKYVSALCLQNTKNHIIHCLMFTKYKRIHTYTFTYIYVISLNPDSIRLSYICIYIIYILLYSDNAKKLLLK